MRHLIDDEPPCPREATREQVWKDSIAIRIPIYLKELCIRYYSGTRREVCSNFQVDL
jgi:hypothetical protein